MWVQNGMIGWISTAVCGLSATGTQLSSDGDLLVMRALDDVLGLSDIVSGALCDGRRGKNTIHRLDGLFRQSVDAQAASASQMGRFETGTLALPENRAALADLSGQWIDRFHGCNGLNHIVLEMDSPVSPTHGEQESTAWNGHFDSTCYHPLFLFNQFGILERCALRQGNVHSADDWRDFLDPVIARYADRKLGGRFYRADAADASPAIYERLEEAGYFYAIRLPANTVLKEKIVHRLTRPAGRPSQTRVKRFYEDFQYRAQRWEERRVIARIEWHPDDLFPRVGFIVTNLPMDPEWAVRFYNQRGTAEQYIQEGKQAFRWTRLSCKRFATTRSGCNSMHWPIIWPLARGASGFPKPCPRHRFPAGEGGRHRSNGAGHPCRHQSIAVPAVMCMTDDPDWS